MKKIFVPDTMLCVATKQVLRSHFDIVNKPEDADAICFTGGEDINPSIYNGQCMNCTYYNESRDKYELSLYNSYADKKFIGICRGAQLLAALKGCNLIQDISSAHPLTHMVDYYRPDGEVEKVAVNSYHHQAIIQPNSILGEFEVLMECDLLNGYTFNVGDSYPVLMENVATVDMFKAGNVFGVQYHPELSGCSVRGIQCFLNEVKTFLEE